MKKITAMQFTVAKEPITSLTTKFGGQPVWLETPQWPYDAQGRVMHFVCQIVIDPILFPEAEGKIAYLFMSNEEDAETWDPDLGDNAVIIQPGKLDNDLNIQNQKEGPTLLDKEYAVELRHKQERYDIAPDLLDEDSYIEYVDELGINKSGGTPLFIQGEEYLEGFEWLLMQLISTAVPFDINFGDAGTGYLFINKTGNEGKFVWQCH